MHQRLIRLLVLVVHVVIHCFTRANVSKARCNFVALEPRHLVYCHRGNRKRVLVCVKDLECHRRANKPDKAGVELLDVMLRANPSFDIAKEYPVTRVNALAVFPPGLPQARANAQRVQGAPCAASPAFPLA